MKHNIYVSTYALTLLVSAALLFTVQPMFSKMILPLLGGASQVWNTAMVFFQLTLLAGYAYAHGTTKFLGVRAQALLHIALLGVFAFLLPILIPEGWSPPVDKDPTKWQLSLMLITVGGPFFILAASAPMLQRWFANTDHPDSDNPYFLYGASNLGSITALLAYPVIIEPFMTLDAQSMSWYFGYELMIILTAICAALVWTHAKPLATKASKQKTAPITWKRRLLWVSLAAVPSSLMLGVTTYITTDIASAPLLWVLPLALYVSTFIIVFARKIIIPKKYVFIAQTILLYFLVLQMTNESALISITLLSHFALFFFSALACHMELADSKPPAENLTEFYLLMSLGGAIGGIFNAIIAPQYFIIPYEYAIALGGSFVVCSFAQKQPFTKKIAFEAGAAILVLIAILLIHNAETVKSAYMYVQLLIFALVMTSGHRWILTASICLTLFFFPPGYKWEVSNQGKIIHQDRNYFGVLKIVDAEEGGRFFMHGTTLHGIQYQEEMFKRVPSSYYGPRSPIFTVFSLINDKEEQNVAVLGLGIGVISCFHHTNRHFDFYEINPKVIEIAENPEFFTYLPDCGSSYETILGDGRIKIAEKPNNYYDIIVMDAFSSDNIPVHIITVEGLEIYLQKLKKDGILAVHISNRYLDLEPVLANAAEYLGVSALAQVSLDESVEGTPIYYFGSHYVVLTRNQDHVRKLENYGWSKARKRKGVKLWTDQYSNIISVLGAKASQKRATELRKGLAEAVKQAEANKKAEAVENPSDK